MEKRMRLCAEVTLPWVPWSRVGTLKVDKRTWSSRLGLCDEVPRTARPCPSVCCARRACTSRRCRFCIGSPTPDSRYASRSPPPSIPWLARLICWKSILFLFFLFFSFCLLPRLWVSAGKLNYCTGDTALRSVIKLCNFTSVKYTLMMYKSYFLLLFKKKKL